MSEWISVNDRLPEPDKGTYVTDVNESEWVLVTVKPHYNAPPYVWMGQYDHYDKKWYHDEGDYSGSEITHWMPLPELPEAKGE